MKTAVRPVTIFNLEDGPHEFYFAERPGYFVIRDINSDGEEIFSTYMRIGKSPIIIRVFPNEDGTYYCYGKPDGKGKWKYGYAAYLPKE